MQREYNIGQPVIYVDPQGRRIPALVKVWWVQWPPEAYQGFSETRGDVRHRDVPPEVVAKHKELHNAEPGCNVVFVSRDGQRNDSCGRQTENATSVVHKGQQVAHGNYWCWPDE